MNFLKISFVLTLLSCVALGGTREGEIDDIIAQIIQTQKEAALFVADLSKEDKEILLTYSNEEILGGFILKMERYEQDDRTKMSSYSGADEHTIMQFNDDLVSDTTLLRIQLAREKDPRRFYQLGRLALSFTKARKADFIPEQFNSLFRDGQVVRYQGQATPSYAGDVSRLAYERITGSLKYNFESDYVPLGPSNGRHPTHEQEVDHLAKWLIANWPGCENFTLSDQNVPAILLKNPEKRMTRGPRSQSEAMTSSPKEEFKWSWQLIAAIVLLIGSLLYWGKKRFAH